MKGPGIGRGVGKMTDLGTDYLKDEKKKKARKHIAELSNEAQIKVEEEKKKDFYVQKYEGKEAILIKGLPYFLGDSRLSEIFILK
jgi:hypothetical protein